MSDQQKALTRGDVARLLSVSERTVSRIESVSGLSEAKVKFSGHQTTRYASAVLRRQSWYRRLTEGQ